MSTNSRLDQQISFIEYIDKLKYITRKTRLFGSGRHENDAEHSWHLAMMALVLKEHSNEQVDLLKVIKMLLIHDIVEINAGDVFLYDTTKNHDNIEEELKAAKEIFGMLPAEQANELINIWLEFEEGETAEARYAHSLDRLEPIMQNASNDGGTWAEFQVPYSTVIHKTQKIEKGSNVLWSYAKELIDDNHAKGIIPNG